MSESEYWTTKRKQALAKVLRARREPTDTLTDVVNAVNSHPLFAEDKLNADEVMHMVYIVAAEFKLKTFPIPEYLSAVISLSLADDMKKRLGQRVERDQTAARDLGSIAERKRIVSGG